MSADSRTRLLDAALYTIRAKGYASTRIDDLCKATGLTKGAFFHHFASKEALALAAADHFQTTADAAFDGAPYQSLDDPVERLLGYVDFRIALLDGDITDVTCLLGTLIQETHTTHPAIREAASGRIDAHAHAVADLVRAAKARYAPEATWDADALALHTQAVIQGAFIVAKGRGDLGVAAESLRHLRRYLELLFTCATDEPAT